MMLTFMLTLTALTEATAGALTVTPSVTPPHACAWFHLYYLREAVRREATIRGGCMRHTAPRLPVSSLPSARDMHVYMLRWS